MESLAKRTWTVSGFGAKNWLRKISLVARPTCLKNLGCFWCPHILAFHLLGLDALKAHVWWLPCHFWLPLSAVVRSGLTSGTLVVERGKLYIYMCIYICVYMYIYICVYICIYIYVFIYICMMCKYLCIDNIYIHYIHICIYTYIYIYVYMHMCI